MPKRKLNAQLQLERATGRAEREKLSRVDINDRLAVRKPRAKEMDPSQVTFLFLQKFFFSIGFIFLFIV